MLQRGRREQHLHRETNVKVELKELEYTPGGKWDCGVFNFKAETEFGLFEWDEVVPGPRHGEDSATLLVKLAGYEIDLGGPIYAGLDFEPPSSPGRWASQFSESAGDDVLELLGAWLEEHREALTALVG